MNDLRFASKMHPRDVAIWWLVEKEAKGSPVTIQKVFLFCFRNPEVWFWKSEPLFEVHLWNVHSYCIHSCNTGSLMKSTGTAPALDRRLCFSFQTFHWKGEREIEEWVKIFLKAFTHCRCPKYLEKCKTPHITSQIISKQIQSLFPVTDVI